MVNQKSICKVSLVLYTCIGVIFWLGLFSCDGSLLHSENYKDIFFKNLQKARETKSGDALKEVLK